MDMDVRFAPRRLAALLLAAVILAGLLLPIARAAGEESTEGTTATEETTTPTEETTTPTEETTTPTEETTTPTEETTTPTEEATTPTEEATDPTEEDSDSTEATGPPSPANGGIAASADEDVIAVYLTSTEVESVAPMYLWIYDKSGTKVAGYSEWDTNSSGSNFSSTGIDNALRYTDSDSVIWHLIPVSYFEQALGSYGFVFDTSECPFQYAPNALDTATRVNASYVCVDGADYYVRIQDTYADSTPRSNVYYTKDTVYPTVESVTPSGMVINLFDYWTTAQGDTDVKTNADTGINADHALKFSYNGRQQIGISVFGTLPEYNLYTKGTAVYPGIVANMLGSDGYPVLSASIPYRDPDGNSTRTEPYTDHTVESLAYLFDPTYAQDGKASYVNVSGLMQVDDSGYYYYNCTENFAEFDTSTNSFTLYENPAVVSGQFFPFNTYEETKDVTATDNAVLNHYFGLTLTTRFSQLYGGYTSSSQSTPTTFEFSGDDDVWIFIDGVLVADLGGIHGAASVVIDFSTGNVTINGTVTNTLKSAYDAAGVVGNYGWDNATFANNTYHTLKFYYLERGNGASNLQLKSNLTEIPETGIVKVNQYNDPVAGAEFAVYSATLDSGEYYYLLDDGTTELAEDVTAKLSARTYTLDDSGNICDASGSIIISAKYTGTTDANGEMVFVNEYGLPYSVTELGDMFGDSFILKETKVPEGYRQVSEDVYLRIVNNQVLVCDNTFDSGVYASPTEMVTATDILYLTDGTAVTYYDVGTSTVNGTLFAVVLKYVGTGDPGNDRNAEDWVPVYGSDEYGYDVMTSFSLDNVIYAAKQMEENGYSDSVFRLSGSGSMQVTLTALPGDISTYYYLAEDKSDTQYTVAYYYTTASSLDGADASNTTRVDGAEGQITLADGSTVNNPGFNRTFGAAIQVPNLSNVLLVQKLDGSGALINGAKFALYPVQEETSGIYYVGYTDAAKTTQVLISLDADTDCDNQGTAMLKDGTTSGTYIVNPGEGADGSENEGVITVTIDGEVYYIYPSEVETTSAAGTQTSSTTGSAYNTSEGGTAVFDNLLDGAYYVREISAPSGYCLNPTEVMALVTGDTIYANAGTADDGVTVARAAGYIVATLDQMAAVGDIDNTLSWVYTTMHINTDQADTFFFDDYASDSSVWSDLKNDSGVVQHAYLTYAADHVEALFDYVVNTDHADAEGYTGTLRLYTDEGWSYLQIFQDTEYHYKRQTANVSLSYAYTELTADTPITNLFSRSVYIQVTDTQTEFSFVKIDADTMDSSDPTTASTLSGAEFTAYPVDDSGGKITTGVVYTVTSDSSGVVTFTGLPAGYTYWVEESSTPAGYLTPAWHWLVTIAPNGDAAFQLVSSSVSTGMYASSTTTEPDVYSTAVTGNNIVTYTTYYWPNYQLYELPSTGGYGIYLPMALGGLLMCSASAAMFGRRKREKGARR